MSTTGPPAGEGSNPYAGWIAGALVILGIMAVGALFWFMHHP